MSNKKKIPDFRSSFFAMQQNTIKRQRPPVWKVFFGLFLAVFWLKNVALCSRQAGQHLLLMAKQTPFESQANNHKEGKKVLKSHCSSLFTITTMVSDSTVKPSLNLEFLFYFMVKRLQKFLVTIV